MSGWHGRTALAIPGWYQTDRLGSVIGVTDASGAVVDTITYDAFLNIQTESNSTVSGNLLGQGMVYYRYTGLYAAGPRQENPLTAKWIQFDPSGFSAGDYDLTRAMGNDPTNAIDPSGLRAIHSDPSYLAIRDAILADLHRDLPAGAGAFAPTVPISVLARQPGHWQYAHIVSDIAYRLFPESTGTTEYTFDFVDVSNPLEYGEALAEKLQEAVYLRTYPPRGYTIDIAGRPNEMRIAGEVTVGTRTVIYVVNDGLIEYVDEKKFNERPDQRQWAYQETRNSQRQYLERNHVFNVVPQPIALVPVPAQAPVAFVEPEKEQEVAKRTSFFDDLLALTSRVATFGAGAIAFAFAASQMAPKPVPVEMDPKNWTAD